MSFGSLIVLRIKARWFTGCRSLISIKGRCEQMVKESNLIDLFGLSGQASQDDQLDALLFRLESEMSAPEDVITTVVLERGESRGYRERRPRRPFSFYPND